jgi:hypothetical protein
MRNREAPSGHVRANHGQSMGSVGASPTPPPALVPGPSVTAVFDDVAAGRITAEQGASLLTVVTRWDWAWTVLRTIATYRGATLRGRIACLRVLVRQLWRWADYEPEVRRLRTMALALTPSPTRSGER